MSHILGEGSYGVVSQSKTETGATVAVKRFFDSDLGLNASTLIELHVLLSMRGPPGVVGTRSFSVTVSVQGVTSVSVSLELFSCNLREYSRSSQVQERIGNAPSILSQLITGLYYLHTAGFMHSDVKPANVLISRATSPPRAVLADFGISKLLRHAPFVGGVACTPGYGAPETQGKYSAPADVWALGCSILEFLICSALYRTGSQHELSLRGGGLNVRGILSGRLKAKASLLPEEFVKLVSSMLLADPERRFRPTSRTLPSIPTFPPLPRGRVEYLPPHLFHCLTKILGETVRFASLRAQVLVATVDILERYLLAVRTEECELLALAAGSLLLSERLVGRDSLDPEDLVTMFALSSSDLLTEQLVKETECKIAVAFNFVLLSPETQELSRKPLGEVMRIHKILRERNVIPGSLSYPEMLLL